MPGWTSTTMESGHTRVGGVVSFTATLRRVVAVLLDRSVTL